MPLRFLSVALCLCLPLAACNTPSPAFRGIPVTRVTVEGSTFDVRRSGNRVELIRTSPE